MPWLSVYSGPNKGLWVIGFVISVVFSFLAALGINMQKLSIREHSSDLPSTPTFRQPVTIGVCGGVVSRLAWVVTMYQC